MKINYLLVLLLCALMISCEKKKNSTSEPPTTINTPKDALNEFKTKTFRGSSYSESLFYNQNFSGNFDTTNYILRTSDTSFANLTLIIDSTFALTYFNIVNGDTSASEVLFSVYSNYVHLSDSIYTGTDGKKFIYFNSDLSLSVGSKFSDYYFTTHLSLPFQENHYSYMVYSFDDDSLIALNAQHHQPNPDSLKYAVFKGGFKGKAIN